MSHSAEEKRRIRKELIAARRAIPASFKQKMDAAIAERVMQSAAWQKAETVFLYVSTGWEVDTCLLLSAAFAAGKRVAVPLCRKAGEMTVHHIHAIADLTPGAFGIPEPERDAPILLPEETDLAIVPAVAYDRDGYRLGRGGGYYDRYLPRVRGITMGLAYGSFLLDAVPREAHDCRVDLIITEEGEILWA